MKAKLILTNQIPGMGGLNRIALIEDGWYSGMILDVVSEHGDRLKVQWGEGDQQSRVVHRHELEILPEG